MTKTIYFPAINRRITIRTTMTDEEAIIEAITHLTTDELEKLAYEVAVVL